MFATAKQLTAEQRLSKAVIAIMQNPKYVALAGVMMIGERAIKDDVPTACTNGRDEYYGRAFVDGLTDAELRFLVLHETYHKLYRHLTTWKHLYEDNAKRANMACDYVINQKIADDNTDGFAVVIKGALIDSQFRDMDSAAVYKLLPDQQDDDDGGDGDGGGLDDHDWEGAQELSDTDKQELERDLDEAIRQGAMAAGKMGGSLSRDIQDLLQPQVDWREVLRDFISATCSGNDYSTWARPNRRFMSSGVYMPSGISEKVDELVLAIDTSGSIRQRELTVFLTEVKKICDTVRPDVVRVLYWDTEVCRDEKYSAQNLDQLVTSTKPAGGGGTSVHCVPKYMQEHNIKPQAVICFTDGWLYDGWGQWSVPILWCLLDNAKAKPDVGKYVNVKDTH
jgi:predicted metal-dependent peptidase